MYYMDTCVRTKLLTQSKQLNRMTLPKNPSSNPNAIEEVR